MTPQTPSAAPLASATPSAAELNFTGCRHCGTVWEQASQGEPCARCSVPLQARKTNSLQRTWAFLIAACLLYLPANLMPVMVTRTLFGTQNDTILSGVIFFWISGAYGLAIIIFVASFLVPLFKLTALFLLVLMAQKRSTWRRSERTRLYHVIELIGRWSMLDVFVVALLAGLVRIQGFAEITAGIGIAAFGSVVVLTMLASMSFDPKLIWDAKPNESAAASGNEPTTTGESTRFMPPQETGHAPS